jgi:hypothetical protein
MARAFLSRIFALQRICGAELLERRRGFTSIKTDSNFMARSITGEVRHG